VAKKTFKVKLPAKAAPERFRQELNDEQYLAVTHQKGPALIIAGAGSGKTRALTYRVAYLIDQGVPSNAIMLVTFTKKAADEMVHRAERVSGGHTQGMLAGTFHHVANIVLRKYAETLGYHSNFTIIDRSDQLDLFKLIMGQAIPKDQKTRYPKAADFSDIYSLAINQERQVDDIIAKEYPQYTELVNEIKVILQAYHDRKRATNVMDFDDLLVNFLVFLRTQPAADKLRHRIRHVLVDEFQDVNAIQADIVYEISRNAESVSVVGDDAQAIYSFRGADFTHMLHFLDKYPGTREYKLEENYRSTPEILALANASIAHNINQFQKILYTNRPTGEKPAVCPCADKELEAHFICQKILQFRDEDIPLYEQAVLFRAAYHRIALEQALVEYNIPYVVRAGVRFFEQAHIKDLLAYLCVMVNPVEQVQWTRILSMHPGIGDAAAQKVLSTFISEPNPLEAFVALDLATALQGKRVRAQGKTALQGLQQFFLQTACNPQDGSLLPPDQWSSLPELIELITKYITPFLELRYKDWKERAGDLRELGNFATKYHDASAFLSDILTTIPLKGESIVDGSEVEEERPLVLSTIHQAKGLEWRVVFVLNCVEGALPISRAFGDPAALEEERRLFYVASTRAKDYLFFTYPEFVPSYMVGDMIGRPSRFIEEIRGDNVFEEWDIEL